jgi:TolB-like protein
MTETHDFLYAFGPYTLNSRERVLRRDGLPVPLAPKALDTLLVLLRNHGTLVEKGQLMSEVWPATFVEEANVTQNISVLRKVLSQGNPDTDYIETIPKRGYRFLVSVRRVSDGVIEEQPTDEVGRGLAVQARQALAILPFANVSADERMDYLSEGITESIIQSLSQLPQLRVMSSNAVHRYRGREMDAQRVGRELGVDVVLVGRVQFLDNRLKVNAELVDVANGWQLWGENYDRELKAILEVQEEIARQISAALRLKLTGDEEQRLTRRYTESGEAYRSYLQARYEWSKFTREGLEAATVYFRRAIALDPNYALAYAGIVDCYLRLATNYIPPTDTPANSFVRNEGKREPGASDTFAVSGPVQTRYKWDWTGVERELKRAAELKSSYPAAHQWRAAYLFSLKLYRESQRGAGTTAQRIEAEPALRFGRLEDEMRFGSPTPAEEVQVFCTIARDQIAVGNYEGGCQILQGWWTVGEWPKLEGLSSYAAGDLLFTAGALTGWVATSRHVPAGQRQAEGLINAATGIFENLGLKARSAEAQSELGHCFVREGLFDLAQRTLNPILKTLGNDNLELKSVALLRAAIVDRRSGRLKEALVAFNELWEVANLVGPWVTARHQLETATTLKNLAIAEDDNKYFEQAVKCFQRALYEFEAIGNHRYAAIIENNHGFLLVGLGELQNAEAHLRRARCLFDSLNDKHSKAQVDETLARLHLAEGRVDLAHESIIRSVESLEAGDEEAVLADALITRAVVLARLGRWREAKSFLDRGKQVAERCGDIESERRALTVIFEEMHDQLSEAEKLDLEVQFKKLLGRPHPPWVQKSLENYVSLVQESLNPRKEKP